MWYTNIGAEGGLGDPSAIKMGNSTPAPPPPTRSSARAPRRCFGRDQSCGKRVARCKRGEEMSGAACPPHYASWPSVLVAQAAVEGH